MREYFLGEEFTKQDVKQMNPLVLAYIGDAVYEIFIRTYIVSRNKDTCVNKLHKKTIQFVKANAQSYFIKEIQEYLNEEEIRIFKRGRNTKSNTAAKNACIQDYRMATGFEAVIGYLYLLNENERLEEIMKLVINLYEESLQNKGENNGVKS
ncbi:Mini-ribonuclease 3 [Clostridium cochlearium]|jgi:ribonuclease-3 family protein|uniref:Mini-ribonuclease 3 n=1 Tax=Clostridium cochlearium TaxID=1494 RepID=A0A240B185_CLOCO|nr:Mini-ribonuclease 3 [Clostridium cochlearium]MBV1820747.1 Mini-ribonuclease 3 [Bacteroidales bacterium MSK.15.36]NSJ92169.1 Mini-ribonuclease 3 [Coprococcus sp. MSK.21.13]MBE6065107.1 Mini-ribonuclease 3 [Clostridium cochlearium]MBU5269802.1 Mini-ribonuclease 3 [Clostridium cochlearium]MCG4572399.1 Mini-ribonuclease 3 [Clostridium cochlearium]